MADRYDAERMYKPPYFRIGILRRGRGNRKRVVIGFDTEQDTSTSEPMLFQFSIAGGADDVDLRPVPSRDKSLDVFLTYLDEKCRDKGTEYIVYGFNLSYEWTQLFGALPDDPDTGEPIAASDEFALNIKHRRAGGEVVEYLLTVANKSRYFATLTHTGTKRRIRILDARAFYTTSLDGAAKMLGLPRKVEIASKRFTRADMDNPLFLMYARQDAYITRRLGEEIVAMHEDYDVPTTITAPHFASSVFRHAFLDGEIPLADQGIEQAGLYAYHGGKNGYYLNGPKHLTNVYNYDITSAYPEAMRALPDPVRSTWEYSERYEPGVAAIWCVSGEYRSCKYRGIMRHSNDWHGTGTITDAWTTSYELDAAIARGEIELTAIRGHVMRGPIGTGPLVAYVDRFFEMKRTATGAARVAAKLFLNSLYGKFFQKVPLGDVGTYDLTDDNAGVDGVEWIAHNTEGDFDYQAGGLYHPPIAALITGFVRARIHTLEHKYGALMTSTDGFFAVRAPDPADVGTGLGKLTVQRGDLSIWRERLYDFAPADGSPSKFALHGFRGTVDELRRIPLTAGAFTYTALQMITTKLAIKMLRGVRYRPGSFVEMAFTLDLTAHAPP